MKLVEYDLETKKFLRFLKFNGIFTKFLYGDHYIEKINTGGDKDNLPYRETFFKDTIDPLNRFNGLFDGRTYGKGRFVLDDGDDVIEADYTGLKNDPNFFKKIFSINHKIIGNLHENPELWEKIK